jgi:phage tail-like protein
MFPERSSDYLNLNRDGTWTGFSRFGLDLRADGTLELASVPLWEGGPLPNLADTPVPQAPSGIAIDDDGTVYYSDPSADRVWRIDGCTGDGERMPCVGGAGEGAGQFHEPRGLLVPRARHALFVADSGNHRVQVFDPSSGQLLAIWGQPGTGPSPGTEPGRFSSPWTVAGDAAGNVYVLDYGNRRVQQFDGAGNVQPRFWENVEQSGLLREPGDLAVREEGDSVLLFVVDRELRRIFVFDARGFPARAPDGEPLAVDLDPGAQSMGLAARGDALFLGDNGTRRLLQYRIGEALEEVGEAEGYRGPVSALAVDRQGRLLVHSGSASPPLRLAIGKGHRRRGALWTRRPIAVGDAKVAWHRLSARIDPLPPGAHLRFFVHVSNDSAAPAVGWDGDRHTFFADAKWRQADLPDAPDVTDLYIGGDPASSLWIGAEFAGDGRVSPALSEVRVEFDHDGYLPYLPALYRNDAVCGDFLPRLLSLFESFLSEVEWEIDDLPRLFDPAAAPSEFLDWLGGWFGLELDEGWDDARRRRTIAEAFALSARRGTRAGLERSLWLFGGVPAIVEEPLVSAAWWVLPARKEACCEECADGGAASAETGENDESSVLGWSTMLASAQPDGAVTGTTAILGESHLIPAEEFGGPLFTELAHRFNVWIPRGYAARSGVLARVKAVIDREKPAHTEYHLCIVEPRMRVGFQARVGMDTVVAGPPASLRLGESSVLGEETALGGPAASRIGEGSRLGITTRVG